LLIVESGEQRAEGKERETSFAAPIRAGRMLEDEFSGSFVMAGGWVLSGWDGQTGLTALDAQLVFSGKYFNQTGLGFSIR
jgi:hypothetical protein